MTLLTGWTSAGDPATATYEDGRPVDVAIPLTLRCAPAPGGRVWLVVNQLVVPARRTVRFRARGLVYTWSHPARKGRADVDFDARFDAGALHGTVDVRLALDAGGVRADCRAEDVAVDLAAPRGRRGRTAQRDPVTAVVGGGSVDALSIGLWLTCDDGRDRHLTWIAPPPWTQDEVSGPLHVSGQMTEVPVSEDGTPTDLTYLGGTAHATLRRDGDTLRGTADARLTLFEGGPECRTPDGGVAFSVG